MNTQSYFGSLEALGLCFSLKSEQIFIQPLNYCEQIDCSLECPSHGKYFIWNLLLSAPLGPQQMAQWGRKHWSGFHRPKPISPLASGRNWAISQNDENNFFRLVMQWTKTEEGWYLKTSAKPVECIKRGTVCARLWFKDAKRNCMQLHRKWERKRWLSLFTHNLLCRVIRSQQTPTLKSLKNTTLWNISSRFDAHTNNNISQQEWRCIT